MKHRKPTGEIELCAQCGKHPRRAFSENCAHCAHENRLEYQRERRRKESAARVPKPIPCKCGCELTVFAPVQYATDECRKKGRAASVKKQTAKFKKPIDHPERFGLKPHRPGPPPPRKQLISEEEQARLDAEASRRDRAWHQQFMKDTLGLESAPGQPLATKVVRPPKEVWRELEKAYRPQSSHEREIFIPARADISY